MKKNVKKVFFAYISTKSRHKNQTICLKLVNIKQKKHRVIKYY